MPIYEYQCLHCHHKLEKLQKINDQPLTDCPSCHRSTLQKKVSMTAFQLKGSGWYATDFHDKRKSNDIPSEPSEKKEKTDKVHKKEEPSHKTTE